MQKAKIINSTKFLQFKSVKSPSGNDWYYAHRTNDTNAHDSAVCITAVVKINDKYNFLLLKTSRPPLYAQNKAQYCIETPAGLIGDEDKNEKLIECAKKELLEETGLIADKLYLELTNSSSSSGLTSETLSYVTAVVFNPVESKKPVSDGGIIVERFYVECDKMFDFMDNLDKTKYSMATAAICGICFAKRRLVNLF